VITEQQQGYPRAAMVTVQSGAPRCPGGGGDASHEWPAPFNASAGGVAPWFEEIREEIRKEWQDDRHVHLDVARTFAKGRHTLETIRTDKSLLLRLLREHKDGWRVLKQAPLELQNDRDLLLQAVRGSSSGWKALLTAPPELLEDREVAMEAIHKNVAALGVYMTPRFRQDLSFISKAMSCMLDRREAQSKNAGRGRRRVGMDTEAAEGERRWDAEGTPLGQDSWNRGYVEQRIEMRITNHRNLFLVRMGRWEGERLIRECTYPGAVVPAGLHAREVLAAYIDSDLNPLKRRLDMDAECEVVVEENSSDCHTSGSSGHELHKHIFTGRLKPGLQWNKVSERIQAKSHGKVQLNSGGLGRRFRRGRIQECAPHPPRMFFINLGEQRQVRSRDIFAWVTPFEYEWLATSELGKMHLEEWLNDLDVYTLVPGVRSRSDGRPRCTHRPTLLPRSSTRATNRSSCWRDASRSPSPESTYSRPPRWTSSPSPWQSAQSARGVGTMTSKESAGHWRCHSPLMAAQQSASSRAVTPSICPATRRPTVMAEDSPRDRSPSPSALAASRSPSPQALLTLATPFWPSGTPSRHAGRFVRSHGLRRPRSSCQNV